MPEISSHNRRSTVEQLGRHASPDLAVWLFFQLAGNNVLLPLLVGTLLFARTVARRLLLINLCCTWIVSGIFSLVLFYSDKETVAEPGERLCIVQSALLSGAFPMTTVACLALVYYTWSTVRHSEVQTRQKPRRSYCMLALLVCAPYIVLALFSAISAKLGTEHIDEVSREQHFFYCSINLEPFSIALAVFSALLCILASALYVHSVLKVVRNHQTFCLPGQTDNVDVQFIVRVGLFTLYMLGVSVANLVSLGDTSTVVTDMLFASVGMTVFFIFGTQPDIIRTWSTCHRGASRAAPSGPRLPRAPYPSFDLDLMKRTDSAVSEKARLDALRAYYAARVRGEGIEVEIIDRPENAFVAGREPRRAVSSSSASCLSSLREGKEGAEAAAGV